MIIPNDIAETNVALMDQYFDLRGLAVYSAIGLGTLRDHIKANNLPAFKVKGKILVKRSEFDRWIEGYRVSMEKQDLDELVDGIISDLK